MILPLGGYIRYKHNGGKVYIESDEDGTLRYKIYNDGHRIHINDPEAQANTQQRSKRNGRALWSLTLLFFMYAQYWYCSVIKQVYSLAALKHFINQVMFLGITTIQFFSIFRQSN